MFESYADEERGQVGIGTLIVFIAMVLVAAIAAGVLVNTAGFLQSTAEETGQQSTDKVTNRLEVVNAHGVVDNADDGFVGRLKLTTRLAAGSDNVNLDNVTVKYLSDDEVVTLNNASTADGTSFNSSALKDADGSFGVYNDEGDRFQVTISADAIETTNGLEPGSDVVLEITTSTGATTRIQITTPDTYADKEPGDPIELRA